MARLLIYDEIKFTWNYVTENTPDGNRQKLVRLGRLGLQFCRSNNDRSSRGNSIAGIDIVIHARPIDGVIVMLI